MAPTTIRETRPVLDRHLHPNLGHLAVGDVTPAVIDAFYARLRCCGRRGGRPLAAATMARVHVGLRAAFGQAMRWGWVWENPAARAHRIVITTTEPSPPTPEELRLLLDHVAERDPQLHAFLVVVAVTGARRAQLLGLRWHNVHHATCRVSFCGGWVEGPHGPVRQARAGADAGKDVSVHERCQHRAQHGQLDVTPFRRPGRRAGAPSRSRARRSGGRRLEARVEERRQAGMD